MVSDSFPYELDETWGCFNWLGKLNNQGRPVIWRAAKPISAIREVFEKRVRPLKADEMPDHLCRNILCVNVIWHVEAVTRRENELRKSFAYLCAKKKCPRGHEMRSALTTPWGGRLCRTCHGEQKRAA